jgi:EAL domain-containing protein (putative c-di-GMP-specific phosphodiesterase class I)
MPIKFIPIAESSGQIISIGKWVIKQAMQDISKWKKQNLPIEVLSINLSVRQLNDKAILDIIKNTLKKTGCKPEWIEFEITEGYAMSAHQAATSLLEEISKLGFKISIDDFGTGYSSLAYLKRLPIQKIKIDQSFLQDIPGDVDDEAIVSAVIHIAKSLNLSIIAEGVENSPQQDFLLEHGCIHAQGYLYTRPMPKDKFEQYIIKQS